MRVIGLFLALSVFGLPGLADTPFASFDRASFAELNDPHDLAVGPDGRLYVADKNGSRIVVMDPETLDVTATFGDGTLRGVRDISFGPDGRAYVAVTGAGAVAVFDISGPTPERVRTIEGVPRTEGALAHSNGTVYAMSAGTGRLVAVDAAGAWIAAADGLLGAHDVAEAPDGTIWVADTGGRQVVQFSQQLERLGVLDGPQYGFAGPRYLDFDDFGRMVVADQDAHRVLLIDPESDTLLGVLGDGTPGLGPGRFDDPEGVAAFGNSYFISDSDNNRVVKYVVILN